MSQHPGTQRTVFRPIELKKKSSNQAFSCCASLGRLFFVGTQDGTIIFYELRTRSGSTDAQIDYETVPKEIVRVPRAGGAGGGAAATAGGGSGAMGGGDTITQIVPFRTPRMMLVLTQSGRLYFIPQLDTSLQLKPVEGLRNLHVHKIACKVQRRDAFAALQVRKVNGERQLLILRLDQRAGEWVPALPAPSVLPDDVQSLTWSGNVLVLGFAREYCHFDVTKQEMRSVAKAGHHAPIMSSLFPMRETYCSLDELLLPIGLSGEFKEARASILKTKLPASSVAYAHPYSLALVQSEGAVQVHFPWYPKDPAHPRDTLCQPIVIKNALQLNAMPAVDFDAVRPRDMQPDMTGEYRQACEPDVVIVITNDNSIYLLDQLPIMDQVRSLYRMMMFDDAGLLAELSPHAVPNTVRAELALNHANHLINERRPTEAFRYLNNPTISVASVLRFFPDEYRFTELVELVQSANASASIRPPDLNAQVHGSMARFPGTEEASVGDRDSENFRRAGLKELQTYLIARRAKHLQQASLESRPFANVGGAGPAGGTPTGPGGGAFDEFGNPAGAGAMQSRRPTIMRLEELRSRGDLDTKQAALIDTALLVVSVDRFDDNSAIELLKEDNHRCILEPSARFLAQIGADAVLVALLRASGQVETALGHLHVVAATGRSPDGQTRPPTSLTTQKELSDFFRRRMDRKAQAQMMLMMNSNAAAGGAAGGGSAAAGGGAAASAAAQQSAAAAAEEDEAWNVDELTRAQSLALVKKYRPESRQPERLARQVTAVLAAFALAHTSILESSTTRSAAAAAAAAGNYGTPAGGGAVGAGVIGGGGLSATSSSLGANPFQKLGVTWLFTEDALPDSFLCEQLFSLKRALIAPRAIADFVSSPALRIAFIETLLENNREQVEQSAQSTLSEEDLRELHNLMVTAFLDRHRRDGSRDQSIARKLFDFVSSQHARYSADIALEQMSQFGNESALALALVDSRAELLARCARFEEAVEVMFTAGASGAASAEQFCRRVRNIDRGGRSFAKLLERSMARAGGPNSETGRREGIRLLTANPWVDPHHVWELLPDDTKLHELKDYLALALQERSYRAHRSVLHAEILRAALLQRQVALSRELSRSAEVSVDTVCGVCGRRIQSSLLARFPNGQVVHHACAPDEHVCPVTRVNFTTLMPAVSDAQGQ